MSSTFFPATSGYNSLASSIPILSSLPCALYWPVRGSYTPIFIVLSSAPVSAELSEKKAFLKLLKVVHPVTRLNVSSKQITTPSFFFILFLQIILLIAFSIFYRAAAAGFVLFLCFLIKFFLYNKTVFL